MKWLSLTAIFLLGLSISWAEILVDDLYSVEEKKVIVHRLLSEDFKRLEQRWHDPDLMKLLDRYQMTDYYEEGKRALVTMLVPYEAAQIQSAKWKMNRNHKGYALKAGIIYRQAIDAGVLLDEYIHLSDFFTPREKATAFYRLEHYNSLLW